MAKLKAVGKSSALDAPTVSGKLAHVELELRSHREETNAILEEFEVSLKASIQASIDASLSTFQRSLMEQFQQQLAQLALPRSSSVAVPERDGSVLFGSLPQPAAVSVSDGLSSSATTRSEGIPSHIPSTNVDMSINDVLSALVQPVVGVGSVHALSNSTATSMTTTMHEEFVSVGNSVGNFGQGIGNPSLLGGIPFDPGVVVSQQGLTQSQCVNLSFGQLGASGSILGQPPSLALTQSLPLYQSIPSSQARGSNSSNLFSMSYSGPYTASALNFGSTIPSFPSSCAVPRTTSLSHSSTPHFSTAGATNTTITTHTASNSFNHDHTHQHYNHTTMSPHSPHQSQFCQQQCSHNAFDPSLPTMRQMKLDFSLFDGGDPVEWLNKCEQYFEFYQIPEERKLTLASMHLTAKASDRWYMFRHEFPPTWQGLADLLMREFSGYNRAEYHAALARMNQTGSVEQFMEEFTKLSRRTPGLPADVLIYFFIGGLREDIRSDVQALKPRTLYEAFELARVYERRNATLRHYASLKQNLTSTFNKSPAFCAHAISGNQKFTPPFPNAGRGSNSVPSIIVQATPLSKDVRIKLTDSEFEARRARKQCYFCDAPYVPGHNCRKKGQLMSMEIVPDKAELVNLEEVHIAGCQVVLGAAWLRSLGDIMWNFGTMRMRFPVAEQEFLLQGETKTTASVISCRARTRLLRKEKEALRIQVQSLQTPPATATQSKHAEITNLLQKYADLFTVSTALPSARPQYHSIELLPNTPPVNVRPYRYPHFQKSEIEKMVQELLDLGADSTDTIEKYISLNVLTEVSTPIHHYVLELQQACESDTEASQLLQQLHNNTWKSSNFTLHDGQLYFKQKQFVPVSGGWRNKITEEFHCDLKGGHAGIHRTEKRIRRSFAGPGMYRDIKRFVSCCHIYQQNHYYTAPMVAQLFVQHIFKVQPYKQQSVQKRNNNKLAPRYYGPYLVEKKIGQVAYQLKLPPTAKVHNVFHVSLLKKKVGDKAMVVAHFPPDIDPHSPRWYPAAILERKIYKKGTTAGTKWLIQWLGAGIEEATWEDVAEIMHRFPDFSVA